METVRVVEVGGVDVALSTNISIGTKTDTNRKIPVAVNKIGGALGLTAKLAVACTAH